MEVEWARKSAGERCGKYVYVTFMPLFGAIESFFLSFFIFSSHVPRGLEMDYEFLH